MSVRSSVVVSAHLDDAVLSCGGRLGPDTYVVTAFAGIPPVGQVSPWDRVTGARDSHRRMRERREEDRKALSLLGAAGEQWDFLESEYRLDPPDVRAFRETLAPLAAAAQELWLPAAVGGHPDHVLARDLSLPVALEVGIPVRFYADLPYALLEGWSPWAGDPRDQVDPTRWLEDELEDQLNGPGLPTTRARPQVHRLDSGAVTAKRQAMECYRTQLSALDDQCSQLRDARFLQFELSWYLQPEDTQVH